MPNLVIRFSDVSLQNSSNFLDNQAPLINVNADQILLRVIKYDGF